MADETFCREAAERTAAAFGRIDHLVNNAFAFTAKALDATTADWMRSFSAGPSRTPGWRSTSCRTSARWVAARS
jgi:NAD(P)-dependent dehydrogenase (short-subunit alcohol dehydrogenase family)